MANRWTFRLDLVDGVTPESVRDFLSSYPHCVFLEEGEETGKIHVQGYLWTDVTTVTIGNRMKTRWPVIKGVGRGKSKGLYSCAPLRKDFDEHYWPYICKGTTSEPPRLFSCQPKMDEDLSQESILAAWRRRHSQRREEQSTVPKNMHIVDEAIAYFDGYTWNSDDQWDQRRMVVAGWVVDRMVALKKNSFDTFRTRTWVNAVSCRIDPEFNQVFKSEICSRI